MENFLWSYCLNEEQYTKLYRIICKVPGLLQYLTDHNDRELTNHILNYKMLVETEGKSTLGIRMNLELIKNRYDIFRKEYENSNRNENEFSYDFDLNHVLTWNPKPQWTNGMTVEEIDYLVVHRQASLLTVGEVEVGKGFVCHGFILLGCRFLWGCCLVARVRNL